MADYEATGVAEMNIAKLEQLFPSAVTEVADAEKSSPGQPAYKKAVDFDKLRLLLGDKAAGERNERYEFTWAGKSESIAQLAAPIQKTLRPCPELSRDWDVTKNIYIEGDNQEVLKLLQESHQGKVKAIYIDPPYNTGKDTLAYSDNYRISKAEYEERTGGGDGKPFCRQNNKINPHLHSEWCAKIYPRLLLARSLLKSDGAIFISIDDHELVNLRKICDEIFSENNFVGCIVNVNNPKGRSDGKFIAVAHEYLLVYAKDIEQLDWRGFQPDDVIVKRYNKTDESGERYRELDLRKTGENDLREDRPNLFYYFYYHTKTRDFYPSREEEGPKGYLKITPTREDGREGNWRWSLETAAGRMDALVPKRLPSRKVWSVMVKDYLSERGPVKPTDVWAFKDVNSERGTEEFIRLGFDKRIFPKPKPVGTILRCLTLATGGDDIVMDFYSGSGTAAQAVMLINAQDGGRRSFILVQTPEPTAQGGEARRQGYRDICAIARERIRRAGDKLREQEGLQDLDIGFRVFKTDSARAKEMSP